MSSNFCRIFKETGYFLRVILVGLYGKLIQITSVYYYNGIVNEAKEEYTKCSV